MSDTIRSAIQKNYGSVAASSLSSADTGVRAVAEAFGYSGGELDSIPAEANMGLSCGNPTASASLRPGEVVVDLGCGGGLDVFLAAQKVGPTGKAIGIDMTPQMIDRAKKAATKGTGGKPITNVEFHLANIDQMPLADASADVVISNCVINLAPDKNAVFREVFRVLKPGGRVAVSDLALKKPLPPEIVDDVMAFVGCIAGAISTEDFRQGLKAAGFEAVVVIDSGADLNAYAHVEGQSACCAPPMQSSTLPIAGASCCGGSSSAGTSAVHAGISNVLEKYDLNEYAASVKVYAVKPSAAR